VFRQALRELGYIEGENILIEDRFAAGSQERLREYVAEAIGLKVDVILAISSSTIHVSTKATKTIPIVGLDLESDPVASGFVTSLARPGGNLTGVFVDLPELFGKGSSYSRKRSQRLPPSPFCGIPAWTPPRSARSRSPPTRCSCNF
jgi:putative tryptophan/tyrosine transport system substrate-binding protein